MKILIACEFSGIVRDAFISKGHIAWSCDLLPTEREGPHIQGNVLSVLDREWDMMIAFPPCTYLSVVANRWKSLKREEKRKDAYDFFVSLWNCSIPKICIENPVGYMNTHFRKPDQIVHPYMFGEPVQKRTCLWLKNLCKLEALDNYKKPEPLYICKGPKSYGKPIHWVEGYVGGQRAKNRSKTFQSIAQAMADQWG